jgi:hypothetical protein
MIKRALQAAEDIPYFSNQKAAHCPAFFTKNRIPDKKSFLSSHVFYDNRARNTLSA